MVVAVRATKEFSGTIQYGPAGGPLTKASAKQTFKANETVQVRLDGLQPSTSYSYKVGDSPTWNFRTQRKVGEPFSFIVQGDSHPERTPKMHVPALYERTLSSAAALKPDFFICMGDDFSVDTLRERTQATVEGVYLRQLPYLSIVGQSAPIYLVNGNHEQAAKANFAGAESLGAWAQIARNRHFPQPAPDGFYSGNETKVEPIGFLRNYFAWTWGDALMVVIDPYWHSAVPVDNRVDGSTKRRDLWEITLGDEQYRWLSKTLATSKAKFKFVFAHHVSGTGRGGVERAPYYEWGGKNQNGKDEFKSKRPAWELPIHQLMVKHGVSIFFQGHDHIFCKQALDGVVYQTCPVPADASNPLYNADAYTTGDKVSGSGHLRVSVSGGEARVDFLRSHLPDAEKDGVKHFETAYSYSVKVK